MGNNLFMGLLALILLTSTLVVCNSSYIKSSTVVDRKLPKNPIDRSGVLPITPRVPRRYEKTFKKR